MSGQPGEQKPWARLRALIGPVATPIYRAVVARRNARFDRGVGVRQVGVPVISVGNLTVGGTGKTPIVQWIVSELRAAGRRPAIALRGYRSRDGVSDEAEVYRSALAGVPLLVNPDRYGAITGALAQDPSAFDCVVLDDGFQHRQLHRQLDIVVIDSQAGTFTDRLLPSGDLREPLAGLARAGVVIFTHTRGEVPVTLPVGLRAPAIVTTAEHVWSTPQVKHGPPAAWQWGGGPSAARALAVCGIGRPERFFAQARLYVTELDTLALSDHDAFDDATCRRIVTRAQLHGASVVLMTEKDWVKARRFAWPASLCVVVPGLAMRVHDGEAVLRAIHAALGAGGHAGSHAV